MRPSLTRAAVLQNSATDRRNRPTRRDPGCSTTFRNRSEPSRYTKRKRDRARYSLICPQSQWGHGGGVECIGGTFSRDLILKLASRISTTRCLSFPLSGHRGRPHLLWILLGSMHGAVLPAMSTASSRARSPADLPVQAPTKYEMVDQPQDRKGARARRCRTTLLARADEVIE